MLACALKNIQIIKPSSNKTKIKKEKTNKQSRGLLAHCKNKQKAFSLLNHYNTQTKKQQQTNIQKGCLRVPYQQQGTESET